MAGPVQVVGLDEFRKELRQLDDPKAWNKELSAAHRVIGREAAARARSEATSMGGPQKHFARAIRGYGSAAGARIGLANRDANAAFWGAKQDRTGWNAGNGGRPNQPKWIGNTWPVGDPNRGPYAINPAIHDYLPQAEETYGDALDDLMRRAFPD